MRKIKLVALLLTVLALTTLWPDESYSWPYDACIFSHPNYDCPRSTTVYNCYCDPIIIE